MRFTRQKLLLILVLSFIATFLGVAIQDADACGGGGGGGMAMKGKAGWGKKEKGGWAKPKKEKKKKKGKKVKSVMSSLWSASHEPTVSRARSPPLPSPQVVERIRYIETPVYVERSPVPLGVRASRQRPYEDRYGRYEQPPMRFVERLPQRYHHGEQMAEYMPAHYANY